MPSCLTLIQRAVLFQSLSGQGTQIHSNLTFWGGSMFDVDVNDKYCYLIENYFAKIKVL